MFSQIVKPISAFPKVTAAILLALTVASIFLVLPLFPSAKIIGFAIVAILVLVISFFRPQYLVYAALASGIFYTPLLGYARRIGGIMLYPTDAIFILLIGIFLLRSILISTQNLGHVDSPGVWSGKVRVSYLVSGFFFALIVFASLIGLLQGNFWKTVFRESKLLIYYLSIPVIVTVLLRGKVQLKNLLVFLLIASTIGSFYDLYARLFNFYPVSGLGGFQPGVITYADTPFGRIIRDYGWISTFHYQVFSCIIGGALFLKVRNNWFRAALLGIVLVNLIANMLTVTRGFMLGLIIGGLSLLFFLSLDVNEYGHLKIGRFVRQFLIGIAAIGVLYIVTSQVVPQVKAPVYRLLSIFNPASANQTDMGNLNLRLNSIRLGVDAATSHPWGMGFGVKSSSDERTGGDTEILYLLYHNSLGYIFYVFGLFGGIAILGLFGFLIIHQTRICAFATGSDKTISSIFGASFVALLGMAFTSGNYIFAVDNVLPFMIFLLSAIIYLMGRPVE